MVNDLIGLNTADPNSQDTLKTTYSVLTKTVVGDENTWNNFTKDARSTLSVAHPKAGTVVIAEVKILKTEKSADGKRIYQAEIPGTTNRFLIVNPPTADNVKTGMVLMGGVIQPAAAGATGPTVLQGAFLISPEIDRKWTWWVNN